MWVRSQDKKTLRQYDAFAIPASIGSKKNYIQGTLSKSTFFGPNEYALGIYDSLEKAIEEINNLQNTLKNNPNEIYEMK